MKKVAPYLLLICVGLAHCVNCLILSSHWSVTSKAICLTLSSFVFSSAALLVILVWLGLWNTIRKQDGSNRLATLVMKEREIAKRKPKAGTLTSNRILSDFPEEEDPLFRWRVPF